MGEMTNEERDELKQALVNAGYEKLAWSVPWCHWNMTGAEDFLTELRSLLRREERLRVMEAGVRAAEWLLDASAMTPAGEQRYSGSIPDDWETFWAASELLETEVPNGQD